MKIAEIFYSIQGEGILSGVPSVFIRTSGCNLRCRWCDTPYTSWRPEGRIMTLDAIITAVAAYPTRYVVVTGGEPLLMRDITGLTHRLSAAGYHITLETAATVYRPVVCDLASLSPKLSNSTPWTEQGGRHARKHEALRIDIETIREFVAAYPYQLKFVVDTFSDIEEIEKLLEQVGGVDRTRVLLMPQGRGREELSEKSQGIAEVCKRLGFRFCPRLHIDLYGNQRGI
ncbi:MAG: 7-carboxy-7-deazaguanine synthase QueE [candidate division Zixibacteria bacterium]|nr:7-carboxy-7-deazaguanine synthase QueE [candidate division Zixibacteria bacterium]